MDVRELGRQRTPSGQRAQQIVTAHVSLQQPAPATHNDPLFVTTSWAPSIGIAPEDWPASHGATLPAPGALVTIFQAEDRVWRCLGWQGLYT